MLLAMMKIVRLNKEMFGFQTGMENYSMKVGVKAKKNAPKSNALSVFPQSIMGKSDSKQMEFVRHPGT
jgi:hypothetical protein